MNTNKFMKHVIKIIGLLTLTTIEILLIMYGKNIGLSGEAAFALQAAIVAGIISVSLGYFIGKNDEEAKEKK